MQLKVISYNIWDLPLWFVKKRKERIEKVAHYLASSGADVICIQEAWTTENRAVLFTIMGAAGYAWAVAREVSVLVGNSGLITFSKLPIKEKKFTPFSRLSSAFVELFSAKGVLETVVETPTGPLSVFNTHLHSPAWFLSQRIRLRQMKKMLGALTVVNGPAVLAGDFNEDRMWEQKSFTSILEAAHFSPPLAVDEDLLPSYRLENEYVDIWINREKASRRYDYIFIRAVDQLGFQVAAYEPVYVTPVLSDHDPVALTLSSV